jgi:pantothenate kinase
MRGGYSCSRYCVALGHIDPYPWFLNKPLDLVVNEQMVRARITASEWADSWRPFLARLYDLWIVQFPRRYLIAVVGPPGAGKSVFAEELHFFIDKGILHRDAHTVALPMDGFHYPNAILDKHKRTMPDGTELPLSAMKGHPDTIDVARLRRYLQALMARPEYVTWPGYSRYVHDVVPEKYKVHSSVNVVIIEGNYLLLDRGPYTGLPELFNLRIYVDAPAPKIIANLMDRHIRGGQSLEEAKDWVKRVDLPNARVVESTKGVADVIIERDTDDDIASLTWRGEERITSSKAEIPQEPLTGGHTHHGTHLAGETHVAGETGHPGETHHPGGSQGPPQVPPPDGSGPPAHPAG